MGSRGTRTLGTHKTTLARPWRTQSSVARILARPATRPSRTGTSGAVGRMQAIDGRLMDCGLAYFKALPTPQDLLRQHAGLLSWPLTVQTQGYSERLADSKCFHLTSPLKSHFASPSYLSSELLWARLLRAAGRAPNRCARRPARARVHYKSENVPRRRDLNALHLRTWSFRPCCRWRGVPRPWPRCRL